jgi:GAF domain-containing protein
MASGDPAEDEGDLARTLRDVARDLARPKTVEDTLQALVDAAVSAVEGAERAGVLMLEGSKLRVPALTDEVVRRVDELQVELGEGPCLDAVRREGTVLLADTADEPRWQRFGPAAAELGVRSMLSFQLVADDRRLGSFSVFASQPGAFGEQSIAIGDLFATHAAIALYGASRRSQLETALASRDVIGQAKGILMHRDGLDADGAFQTLVEASQAANLKLVDVARWLVDTATSRVAASSSSV